jgi:hypothetical protein
VLSSLQGLGTLATGAGGKMFAKAVPIATAKACVRSSMPERA